MTDHLGGSLASQGLYARAFDLARFCELYLNGGQTPDGRQVIPAEWGAVFKGRSRVVESIKPPLTGFHTGTDLTRVV